MCPKSDRTRVQASKLSCYSKAKCNTLDNPSDPTPGFKLSLQRLKVAERISQRRQLIQDFVGEFGFVPPVRTLALDRRPALRGLQPRLG